MRPRTLCCQAQTTSLTASAPPPPGMGPKKRSPHPRVAKAQWRDRALLQGGPGPSRAGSALCACVGTGCSGTGSPERCSGTPAGGPDQRGSQRSAPSGRRTAVRCHLCRKPRKATQLTDWQLPSGQAPSCHLHRHPFQEGSLVFLDVLRNHQPGGSYTPKAGFRKCLMPLSRFQLASVQFPHSSHLTFSLIPSSSPSFIHSERRLTRMVKRTGFGMGQPGSESQLCLLQAVGPYAGYLTSLWLSFITCLMQM